MPFIFNGHYLKFFFSLWSLEALLPMQLGEGRKKTHTTNPKGEYK